MFVGKEKRNLTIEEEKIIHTICAEFKKTFPQTEVQQKKTVVGIGDPSKHLFCYFIDKDTGFKIKFKSQKVFYNPFEDLSKQISETITLFQKNDFPLSHHKTNTLIPETNPSVLENKQYGILTKEENIFFKILLNNIDPQTGEILQICSESLSILKNVYLRCLNYQTIIINSPIIPNEIEQKILEEYISGTTLSQLAIKYLLPIKNVKRFLKKTGIARRTSLICETYQETLRQIEKNKIYENIGVRWTEQEEEELVNEYTSGCSVSEIAKMHKRKIGGIKARLVRLGFAKYRKDITNIYVPPTL